MRSEDPDRVRRVRVTDPVAAARDHDYADSFELRLEGPDPCSPEAWVRAGVDAVPTWIKRIAGSPDGLGSARVVASGPDVVVLEDSDPLMDTVMVGRNLEPDRRVLTTVLRYRRPRLARAVWALVGILHRRTARRVVAGGLPRSSPQVAADRLRPLVALAIAVSVVHYADTHRPRRGRVGTAAPRPRHGGGPVPGPVRRKRPRRPGPLRRRGRHGRAVVAPRAHRRRHRVRRRGARVRVLAGPASAGAPPADR